MAKQPRFDTSFNFGANVKPKRSKKPKAPKADSGGKDAKYGSWRKGR